MPRKRSRKSINAALDREFSLLVRSRGVCERCGRRDGEVQLQCAHIASRRHRRLRWDSMNSVCLCASCHREGHDKPLWFAKWIEETFPERYAYVMEHQNTITKRTDADLLELLSELRGRLKEAA